MTQPGQSYFFFMTSFTNVRDCTLLQPLRNSFY